MGKQGGNKKKNVWRATSNFARHSRVHTCQSGRSVEVWETISYMWTLAEIGSRGDAVADALVSLASDMATTEFAEQPTEKLMTMFGMVQQIVKKPRILIPGTDEAPEVGTYGEDFCWLPDFYDDEIVELMDIARAASEVRQVAGFPGGAASDDGGADREVLGDDPEQDSGVAGGVVAGGDG